MGTLGLSENSYTEYLQGTYYSNLNTFPGGGRVIDSIAKDAYFSFQDPLLHERYLKCKFDLRVPGAGTYAYKMKLQDNHSIIYLVINGELEKILVNPFRFLLNAGCNTINIVDLDDLFGLYILNQVLDELNPTEILELMPSILKLLKIAGYNLDRYLASQRFSLGQTLLESPFHTIHNHRCLYCGVKLDSHGYFCKDDHSQQFTDHKIQKREAIIMRQINMNEPYSSIKQKLEKSGHPEEEIDLSDEFISFEYSDSEGVTLSSQHRELNLTKTYAVEVISNLKKFIETCRKKNSKTAVKPYKVGIHNCLPPRINEAFFNDLYETKVISLKPVPGSIGKISLAYNPIQLYEEVRSIYMEFTNTDTNDGEEYRFATFILGLDVIEKLLRDSAMIIYPNLKDKLVPN